MKDIIMEVELQQRNHQLDDLLGVLDETFLQLFSIAHLRKNTRFNYILQVTQEKLVLQHASNLVRCRTQIKNIFLAMQLH